MMLCCLLYFKIAFNMGCGSFSAKGLFSLHSDVFSVLTAFKKKVFKSPAILASFIRILSLSTSVVFSEDFTFRLFLKTLSVKKTLIIFQDCYPQYPSRLKLVLTY